jgi:hypothetical protein
MCANCPFAEDGEGLRLRMGLKPGRWRDILKSLKNDQHFICHKTSTETGDGTNLMCAGALAWQQEREVTSNYQRVCERIDAMKNPPPPGSCGHQSLEQVKERVRAGKPYAVSVPEVKPKPKKTVTVVQASPDERRVSYRRPGEEIRVGKPRQVADVMADSCRLAQRHQSLSPFGENRLLCKRCGGLTGNAAVLNVNGVDVCEGCATTPRRANA